MPAAGVFPAAGAAPRSLRAAWRVEVEILAVVLIWGANFAVTKDAVHQTDPYVYNAARLTISTAFLALVAWRSGLWPAGLARRRDLIAMVALGLLGTVGYQLCAYAGIVRTTAGNAALMVSTVPAWTALVAWLAGAERLRPIAWAGLVVAFAGACQLSFAKGADLSGSTTGDLLCLVSAAFWGAYTALSRPLLARHGAAALAFWTMVLVLPIMWIPALEPLPTAPLATPRILFALGFGGLLSSGLSYVLWNRAIAEVGPSAPAAYNNLVPVVAMACGALFLDESIGPRHVVGVALVLSGLTLIRRGRAAR